jgi:hypothetical protein
MYSARHPKNNEMSVLFQAQAQKKTLLRSWCSGAQMQALLC